MAEQEKQYRYAEDYAGRLTRVPGSKFSEWCERQEELKAKMERGEIPNPKDEPKMTVEEALKIFPGLAKYL